MKTAVIYYIVLVVAVVGALVLVAKRPSGPGPLDQFASCVKDSGATFYGAFWCPHCAATKALFGSSAKLLPYVECSTPDGQKQNETCNAAKVESYPTWEFKDGSRLTGEQSLSALAAKTGCVLPEGYK
jgi:thiol-disulfide isomerase/thioredoxin